MNFSSLVETLQTLPLPFWVVMGLLMGGAWWAVGQSKSGVGVPTLAVLGTVTVWYVGDALYNDYATHHLRLFEAGDLSAAWSQVAWFVGALLLLAGPVHRWLNGRHLSHPGQIHFMMTAGRLPKHFEVRLQQFLIGCGLVFMVLAITAAIRLGQETPYYFFPPLGYRADPWARGQIGSGASALLSTASYLQVFIAAMFGVIAALARTPWVRILALLGCLLTWPYFLFDRTRNVMIAVALPGILSWVFVRLRWSGLARVGVLALFFLGFNAWFKFIIQHRTDTTIVAALHETAGSQVAEEPVKHHGLNMYEELCWINSFIRDGTYRPNWGIRYLGELVNPVPRSLWPGKPTIGLDYSVARGQQYTEEGTTATVSTGLIGQGVVNFGRFLGPAFAAFLMSLWIAVLARLDLEGAKIGRLPLYAIGLVLTFNLGRDITFLTLYTFAFGWLIVWWLGRKESGSQPQPAVRAAKRQRPTRSPRQANP